MKYFLMIWAFAVVAAVILLGPRGSKSRDPQLYLFDDMDIQPKNLAQSENSFFEDGTNSRPPVPGTVGRGYAWDAKAVFAESFDYPVAENPPLYTGLKTGVVPGPDYRSAAEFDGWYEGFPVKVDEPFLRLGQQKYEINCTVCHGALGDGKGVLNAAASGIDGESDYTQPRGYFGYIADLTAQQYIDYPEGKLWDRITNGWNTMYPYKDKLTPRERWAVVAYVRALQLAANARVEDVPKADLSQLGL